MVAYVYIMTNKPDGTLYIGMTRDLGRRGYEHQNKIIDGFTKRYNLTRLVYFEKHEDAEKAEKRERQIKEWKREWKVELITQMNPEWNDLYNYHLEQLEGDPDLRRDGESIP